jgi:hypothetical protein
MTNKEKIKYLSQYTKLIVEYEHIFETYKKLLDRLDYPSPRAQMLSDTPGGNSNDNPIEAEYIRLIKLEFLINDIRKRLSSIEESIYRLEDSTERLVLRLRYIDGMQWEKICVKISYEWTWTHRIHSNALEQICIKENRNERVDG